MVLLVLGGIKHDGSKEGTDSDCGSLLEPTATIKINKRHTGKLIETDDGTTDGLGGTLENCWH